MGTVQLNTVSTVDAVCRALESDILGLRFGSGGKVVESDLAIRYGVSRNTVREAIAHLLAQGLLTKQANKGVYIRQFSVEDVREIFHLRALLEKEAIKTIIQTGTKPVQLMPVVEMMEQLDRSDQWDAYVRADIQFHTALVDAASSARLSRLYQTILAEVKLCIYQTKNYVQVPQSTASSHRLILEAICDGDYGKALDLVNDHIENVIKRYCSGLIAMDAKTE